MAELLGLKPEDGRQVTLGGVGGGGITAYVHALKIRFDEKLQLTLPFAIATSEEVPNLLGREGVFECLQLGFDATVQATWIRVPWLAPNHKLLYHLLMEASRFIIAERWDEAQIPEPGKEAAGRLLRRAEQLVSAGTTLMKEHQGFETPLIIRSLFELSLQFEYLMTDPARLGKQYLDYAAVTRHQWSNQVVKHGKGPIADFIAQSPMRSAGEARNQTEFDAVKESFVGGNGKHVWDCWYCMSLRELAKKMSWESEYVFWYKMGSGWIHGDPFLASRPLPHWGFENQSMLLMMCHYYGRMLRHVSRQMILPNNVHEFLKSVTVNIS